MGGGSFYLPAPSILPLAGRGAIGASVGALEGVLRFGLPLHFPFLTLSGRILIAALWSRTLLSEGAIGCGARRSEALRVGFALFLVGEVMLFRSLFVSLL